MWLSGWAKRIKVTVSNTNIDSDLTHFPLLLTLGTSVGTGGDDVSCVFDELGSDNNRKKIAVTKTDGTTQCYVEIEKWDDANEKAVLWVSKSDLVLSASGTTDLYLYYDSSQSDNTTYVGDVGSRTEVWDSNFKMVQHLNGSSYSNTIDSTSNNNDGASETGTPTYGSTGKINSAVYFDDTRESINISDSASLDISSYITLQAFVTTKNVSLSHQHIIDKYYDGGTARRSYRLKLSEDELQISLGSADGSSAQHILTTDFNLSADTWYHLAATWGDDNTVRFYKNGVASSDTGTKSDSLATNDAVVAIGDYSWASGESFYGTIDEVRISSVARSAAWIKADYYAQSDNLVSWGSEENAPSAFIPQIIMF